MTSRIETHIVSPTITVTHEQKTAHGVLADLDAVIALWPTPKMLLTRQAYFHA